MKDIQSKYVIYSYYEGHKMVLTNDTPDIQPLFEHVIENATIHFNDDHTIVLEGDEWQFGICFEDTYPSKFDYEIAPEYISKTWFTKKDIVRSGWHRKLHNKHIRIVFAGTCNIKLEEYKD